MPLLPIICLVDTPSSLQYLPECQCRQQQQEQGPEKCQQLCRHCPRPCGPLGQDQWSLAGCGMGLPIHRRLNGLSLLAMEDESPELQTLKTFFSDLEPALIESVWKEQNEDYKAAMEVLAELAKKPSAAAARRGRSQGAAAPEVRALLLRICTLCAAHSAVLTCSCARLRCRRSLAARCVPRCRVQAGCKPA